MADLLVLKNRGSGNVQPGFVTLEGSSVAAYGGPISRETVISDTASTNMLSHRAAQISQQQYYVHASTAGSKLRIYRTLRENVFSNGKVQKLVISGNPTPGGNPLSGETVTQGAVTGTMVEDYKTGDLYVIVKNVSGGAGTFASGAITFSGGDSATVSSVEDNGGEHYLDYESDENVHKDTSYSLFM